VPLRLPTHSRLFSVHGTSRIGTTTTCGIWGSAWPCGKQSSQDVPKEYDWVPEETYRLKRAEVFDEQGLELASRSRGTSMRSGPSSVNTVLPLVPLRWWKDLRHRDSAKLAPPARFTS
jgi:hypothetical protein